VKLSIQVEIDQAHLVDLARGMVGTDLPMELVEREANGIITLLRPNIDRFGELTTRIMAACLAGRVLFPDDEDRMSEFVHDQMEWMKAAFAEGGSHGNS
jgi:hypothetical protein